MRGFGAVQACFAYESQMDRLAEALRAVPGRDPHPQRRLPGLDAGHRAGDRHARAAGRHAPRARRDAAARRRRRPRTCATLPGGVSQTTHGEGVRRGVGYGVGIKNICFSEGFDDYSTARVRVELLGGEPHVLVHTAAAEVGQGLVTVQAQIARTELGVEQGDGRDGRHDGGLGRAPPRPPASRTSPAARSRPPARPCGSAWTI